MKEYAQIISKIQGTPWYITEGGLRMILQIAESHISGTMDIEQIRRASKEGKRDRGSLPSQQGSVGILPLHGPIFPKANLMTELSGATSMEQFAQDFRALMDNDRVDSILLDVDSPGGSASMIEEMANEIFAARSEKPIYAVANNMCGSAAYYLASQASEIYSTDSGIVGSIGTYFVHTDDSELKAKVGIKETVIKEGRFKAALVEPLTAETHEHLQGMVTEFNSGFLNAVARGRNTTVEDVTENYGEGGILSAKQALGVGMVDGVRTFDEVLTALLDGGGTVVQVQDRGGSSGFSLRASLDKEMEHSDPGTGSGGEPEPRPDPEDEHIDDWKGTGARLHRPPNIPELEESAMDRKTLEAYAKSLGLEQSVVKDLSDEELATKIGQEIESNSELVQELKPATEAAAKAASFAQQFPQEAERLQNLEARDRVHEANTFAASLADFTVTAAVPEGAEEGTTGKEIKFRLSTLAQETVKTTHMKLSAGDLSHTDLAELVKVVATSGVQQGEEGSSRLDESATYETSVPTDRLAARKAFAQKVADLQQNDNMSRKDAIAEAGKRYPELAQAYRTA